jgi:phosphoglycolate phosphatase
MGRDINNYKHIIWDWNGTLFNDAWLCVEIMNESLSKRNLPQLSLEKYEQVFQFPVETYYKKLGFDFEKDSFADLGTEFIMEYEKRKHECQLQPSAKETLAQFQKMGVTQSLLSAYKTQTLIEIVRHNNVFEYFIKIIGLDNHYAFGKKENGIKWVKELQFSPKEILLIGDTQHDYEVAVAVGVDCLLIPSGHTDIARLRTTGQTIIPSLTKLLKKC